MKRMQRGTTQKMQRKQKEVYDGAGLACSVVNLEVNLILLYHTEDGDELSLPLCKGNHFKLKQECVDSLEKSALRAYVSSSELVMEGRL